MKPGKVAISLVLFIMSSSISRGQTQSESGTGLEGVITIAPVHPGPVREDVPSSGPLANIAFVANNEKGVVASFTTDDQGRFRISLVPGHYTVSQQERRIRRCGPFDVDVVAGKMTRVEWSCDSGMR